MKETPEPTEIVGEILCYDDEPCDKPDANCNTCEFREAREQVSQKGKEK
jgi:hypothetical protein